MASLAFPEQLHIGTLAGLAAYARAALAHERAEDPNTDALCITVETHDGLDVITYEWQQRGMTVGGMTL